MEVSYYPGCSLEHGMASDYDQSVRLVCERLGVSLTELADWNCCGASSAHFLNEDLAVRLPVRNMEIAEKAGHDVLVPCALCFHQLKLADKELKKDPARWTDESYRGQVSIYHLNEFFDRPELTGALKASVTKPLTGLAGVAYYGCVSQRPAKITDAVSPENPTSMDNLMRAIGMEVRPWSYKTDCCGASLVLTRTDVVHRLTEKLLEGAVEAGAECIVVDCPMCHSNLDTRQEEIEAKQGTRYNLPILYLTELMALALGEKDASRWLSKHFVSPLPLLHDKGLL